MAKLPPSATTGGGQWEARLAQKQPQRNHSGESTGVLMDRVRFLRASARLFIVKLVAGLWGGVGALDLVASQGVPKPYSEKLPRLYEVVMMANGLMTWATWAMIGVVLLSLALLEGGYRAWRESEAARMRAESALTRVAGRKPLSDAAARLRISIDDLRNGRDQASQEWAAAKDEFRLRAEQLASGDKLMMARCREAIHLGNLIADDIAHREDYRSRLGAFYEITTEIQRVVSA